MSPDINKTKEEREYQKTLEGGQRSEDLGRKQKATQTAITKVAAVRRQSLKKKRDKKENGLKAPRGKTSIGHDPPADFGGGNE